MVIPVDQGKGHKGPIRDVVAAASRAVAAVVADLKASVFGCFPARYLASPSPRGNSTGLSMQRQGAGWNGRKALELSRQL
jgi:hypothetical protein